MGFYLESSFEPERSLGYLIRVINRAGMSRLEPILAAEDLSNTQWQVLVLIYFGEGVTCAALARDLAHDKGAMTRLIDGLEERGLVRRARNADDRRLFELTLTPEGRTAAERGKARVVECWNRWLTDWKHDEVEQLITLLQRLRTTIEASPDFGPEGCA